MTTTPKDLANNLLNMDLDMLTEREKHVLERITNKGRIAKNTNREFDSGITRGQRVADRVAEFGGSWTFIILFGVVLVLWTGGNVLIIGAGQHAFDPYPFIFLNLILSMLAAIQAPIIMMSQNRQAEKDRITAGHDYEVNLKAELEIMQLHNKLDDMRQSELLGLVEKQTRQIDLMEQLLARKFS